MEWTGRQVGEALVAALCPGGAPPHLELLMLAALHLARHDRVAVRLAARESGRDRGAERSRVAAATER